MIIGMTALLLALAVMVGMKNFIYHLDHDDHEGVAKWTILTLFFGISLLITLFA